MFWTKVANIAVMLPLAATACWINVPARTRLNARVAAISRCCSGARRSGAPYQREQGACRLDNAATLDGQFKDLPAAEYRDYPHRRAEGDAHPAAQGGRW